MYTMPLSDLTINYNDILKANKKTGIIIFKENGSFKRNTNTHLIDENEKKTFDFEDLEEMYQYIEKCIYRKRSTDCMYAFNMGIQTEPRMIKFDIDIQMLDNDRGVEEYPQLVHIDDIDDSDSVNKIVYKNKDFSDLIDRKKTESGYTYSRKLSDIEMYKKYKLGRHIIDHTDGIDTNVNITIYLCNELTKKLIMNRFVQYVAYVSI